MRSILQGIESFINKAGKTCRGEAQYCAELRRWPLLTCLSKDRSLYYFLIISLSLFKATYSLLDCTGICSGTLRQFIANLRHFSSSLGVMVMVVTRRGQSPLGRWVAGNIEMWDKGFVLLSVPCLPWRAFATSSHHCPQVFIYLTHMAQYQRRTGADKSIERVRCSGTNTWHQQFKFVWYTQRT